MCQGFHLSLNHLLLPQNKYHNSQTESLTTVQRSAGLANEGREMCYWNNRSLLPGCVVPSSQSWALGRSRGSLSWSSAASNMQTRGGMSVLLQIRGSRIWKKSLLSGPYIRKRLLPEPTEPQTAKRPKRENSLRVTMDKFRKNHEFARVQRRAGTDHKRWERQCQSCCRIQDRFTREVKEVHAHERRHRAQTDTVCSGWAQKFVEVLNCKQLMSKHNRFPTAQKAMTATKLASS